MNPTRAGTTRGRPALGVTTMPHATVIFRLPPADKAMIEAAAKAADMSQAAWLRTRAIEAARIELKQAAAKAAE